MGMFTVASVTGGPWVTTTALGLALSWPRPVVLVEADPSGGSPMLAGYCGGLARPGLSELVLAHRHHQLAEELPARLFPLAGSSASLLPGLRAHQQAASILGVWDALLDALRDLEAREGVDVLVDAGRLGMVGSPEALVAESDVTAVFTGSGLPELAGLRPWLPSLRQSPAKDVLVLTGRVRPYSAAEVVAGMGGVPVVGEVPWDPEAARWLSHGERERTGGGWFGRRRPFERSALARSIVRLGESLRALAPRSDVLPSPSVQGAER